MYKLWLGLMHSRPYRPVQLFQQQLQIYSSPQPIRFMKDIIYKLYPKYLYILTLFYAIGICIEFIHQGLFLKLHYCTCTVSQNNATKNELHQVDSSLSVAGEEKLYEVVQRKA